MRGPDVGGINDVQASQNIIKEDGGRRGGEEREREKRREEKRSERGKRKSCGARPYMRFSSLCSRVLCKELRGLLLCKRSRILFTLLCFNIAGKHRGFTMFFLWVQLLE